MLPTISPCILQSKYYEALPATKRLQLRIEIPSILMHCNWDPTWQILKCWYIYKTLSPSPTQIFLYTAVIDACKRLTIYTRTMYSLRFLFHQSTVSFLPEGHSILPSCIQCPLLYCTQKGQQNIHVYLLQHANHI